MKKHFNALREGFLLYFPWYIGGVFLIFLNTSNFSTGVGVSFLLIGVAISLFFRDPPRRSSPNKYDLLAPADGKVVDIASIDETPYYDGPCTRISIFLSVLDVHVNRAPFDGIVTNIVYSPGQFLDARLPETSECNESLCLTVNTEYGVLAIRQIAGKIATRIVCRVSSGERLTRGEKYGMIRFGSRTELYLPKETRICVSLHQRVKAGKTIVAQFKNDEQVSQ